ncbi:MAG: hypothetical protein H6685_13580 [Deltaproteobacteria bacterium]|nr:hypothetical protein [Deltaproteobacteria bacterium]
MTKLTPKKLAAVTAAIAAYMEQEALAARPPQKPKLPELTPWGMSGRQESMQLRIMMQRRFNR